MPPSCPQTVPLPPPPSFSPVPPSLPPPTPSLTKAWLEAAKDPLSGFHLRLSWAVWHHPFRSQFCMSPGWHSASVSASIPRSRSVRGDEDRRLVAVLSRGTSSFLLSCRSFGRSERCVLVFLMLRLPGSS